MFSCWYRQLRWQWQMLTRSRVSLSGPCTITSSGNTSSSSMLFFRHCSANAKTAEADYVVVGAGSAGCVLANRLSEDGQSTVHLLEAGPRDRIWDWRIHMPAALMYNLASKTYNWHYHTVPQRRMTERNSVMYWPRGRVWGGSSALNAMAYVRGHAFDFDRWEQEGAKNWSYADCLPYFRRSQTHQLGSDDYRGGDGPLHVSRGMSDNPLHQAFIDSGVAAGYPHTDDMNGYRQEGFGYMDMTVSAGLLVKKVPGTHYPFLVHVVAGGASRDVYARKEVILSGGAVNSPQLLMLSGVGNADHLRDIGIESVLHLPGVGQNLQDHLEVYVQHECNRPITLYRAQWKFPHVMVGIGMEWFLKGTGRAASSHLESGGFIRSRPGVTHPDVQFHFLPGTVCDHGRAPGDREAFQVHVGTMRALSKGEILLRSANPREDPILDPKYFEDKQDLIDMRSCVRLTREIFAQKPFQKFSKGEFFPGPDVKSDDQIDHFLRDNAMTAYHPSCTCKIGAEDDKMAVVDHKGRVIGAEHLRVVDASVMPSISSGNLNAPTVMLAEKLAACIRGEKPLPRSDAEVWHPKTLKTQRGG